MALQSEREKPKKKVSSIEKSVRTKKAERESASLALSLTHSALLHAARSAAGGVPEDFGAECDFMEREISQRDLTLKGGEKFSGRERERIKALRGHDGVTEARQHHILENQPNPDEVVTVKLAPAVTFN